MSWDHPVARTALEMLLTSEAGNASFGVWEGAPTKGILLETFSVVECVAPASLHSDRFPPATPIRVQVDHSGADKTSLASLTADTLRTGNLHKLLEQEKFRREILPMMLEKCREIATIEMKGIVGTAVEEANVSLNFEIERLVALGEINDHVSEQEIVALRNQRDALYQSISKSRIRLDSLRIIFCTPVL